MNQTNMVIKVLDSSHKGSIAYQNWVWLCQNVEKLNICVCVGDCEANIYDIIGEFSKTSTIVIQEGKSVRNSDEFDSKKEALLLTQYKAGYMVFLYVPSNK